mgnify:CR=1 FL=1
MDKKNYWVIALMVALAVGLLAAVTLLRPSGGQNGEIVVTVDGAEYARVPLGQKQTLTVTQEDGSEIVMTWLWDAEAEGYVFRDAADAG